MPNHVTNIVQAPEHVIAGLMIDGKPDFNAVVPAPRCLAGFEPHTGVVSRAESAMGIRISPDENELLARLEASNAIRDAKTPVRESDIDDIVHAIRCYQECGHVYWHSWNTENWGTKWNAYGSAPERCTETQIHFQTAWSFPLKIAVALSEKFPGETITWIYADEDLGSNCGSVVLKGGILVESSVAGPWGELTDQERKKWTQFAFELCYPDDDPADHEMDDRYEHVEDCE